MTEPGLGKNPTQTPNLTNSPLDRNFIMSLSFRSCVRGALHRLTKKSKSKFGGARVCRFEQLEARRVLAAAIWHNARYPVDVLQDQWVSPLDVLHLINEINARGAGGDFVLPRRLPEPRIGQPMPDVDCDGRISPLDVLLVINHINEFGSGPVSSARSGFFYENAACAPLLQEGHAFVDELSVSMSIPRPNAALKISFETPHFDTSSVDQIRDAFEIEITDAEGGLLVLPYRTGSDSLLNWTEGLQPAVSNRVQSSFTPSGQVSSVVVDMTGIPVGTEILVHGRLINNDSDQGTSVILRGFEFVEPPEHTPALTAATESLERRIATNDIPKLENLTGSISVSYGRTSLVGANNELLAELAVTNRGSQPIIESLIVVFGNFSDLEVFSMRPSGYLPDGRAFVDLSSRLADGPLLPDGTVSTGEARFLNNSGERFTFNVEVFGRRNSAPNPFSTAPLRLIAAESRYRYVAQAFDDDGQLLTYSITSGPSSMTIDAATGEILWTPSLNDVGNHRVILRATDPYGLFVEQSFQIEVVETLQNRPPNFVTDPVTEAIASSGFEISTIAVGASPAGVDVISGFYGPRLVSINAGNQTVSVHAGKKNDRFDDTTVYSTGEPKPTGALIDAGYSVDVGLPPFLVPTDRNEVLGMDQGDLNGDGILDLVVLTARNETTRPTGRVTIEMTRMLGDGDGNFSQPRVIATIPSTTYSELSRQATNLRIADLDGDGNPDVIALQKTTSRLITVRGLGDGSFEPVAFTTLTTALNDFRIEDLDQDGIVDIVGRNANISDLGWMRGTGDGTFAPFVRLAAGGGFWFSAYASYAPRPYSVVDIDNDGDLDIVNSETNGGNIVVWLNDGSQNFTSGITLDPPGNEGSYALHVGDFNGDGRLDILSVNSSGSLDLFVRAPSGLSFTLQTQGDVTVWGRSGNLAGSDAPLDIDGDGDLDLILASTFDFDFLSPQVLINDGTGRFQRTDYQMVDFPGHIVATAATNRDVVRGVMLGDYNRDGVVDFSYMTSSYLGYDFHGVGIRLGTRPGEFGATRAISGISLNRNDTEVHAADFNGDGNIDLLSLLNARMSLGNGDGTFQPAFPATSIPNASTSGVVADFNLDGIPDYAATRGTGSGTKLYIAIGNGDGTFASSLGPDTPGMFYGYSDIRTADFNNDGWPDLIAKGGVERNIDIFLNNPANPGTFTRPFRTVQEVTGVNATGFDHTITTGDFNGDGNIDFVTVDQVTGVPFASSGNPLKLQTFSGDGTGNFTLTNEVFAFDDAMFTEFNFYYPYILQSGDVNSDGNLDIVSFSPYGFIVHLGDGNGSFTSLDRYDFERVPGFTKAGWLVDFDQDGQLDMVYNHADETLSIRRGNGDGTFAPPQRVGTHASGGSLTFADFDNDGHLDMATARVAGDSRPGDVGFYYGTRNGLVDQLAVDLDGDGNEEVLAINEANDRLKIFIGDNLDRLNRGNDLLTGRAPQAVTTGDLNGDGRLEIITANRAGRSISVLTGTLATGYTSSEILVGSAPIDVLTRDINGDGHIDVLVLDEVANAIWVLRGSASGTLATPRAIALGDKPGKFTIADATGDNSLDAVITLPESNRLMILQDWGILPSRPPIYVSLSDSPSDIQVTDFNADGNPDLATTLPNSNALSILYGRGNNQFARAQNISVGSQPTRLTLADADEDGRIDLIVANTGDNTASVIYNRFDPNQVYRYDSDAIDLDDDPITYSIVDGPGGLIINSQTGALLWAASPDQVGEHSVTIAANDGRGGVATQSFKIDVQPARDNAPPLIATEPKTRIGAGETFSYQANALDNDRDTLRYSLINAPAGATIDPTTGQVTWDARVDMALSFAPHSSGNGFDSRGTVAVAAHSSLQPASLTAEGWYNFTSLPASNQFSNIIYQAGSPNQTAYALYNSGNSNLRLELDYPSPINRFVYNVPFVPQINRWYHFAITIDDSTRVAKIFVDGVELGSTTLPGSIVYNPAARAQVGDGGLFFTRAIIDNYRLWNVARTPAEIAEGLSRQYDGDSRVVLDYRFDEPQTLNVRDFSPAGNHGYRKASGTLPKFVPGLAETGSHQFTIGVEDGRGGFDQQSFTLEVLPELRGSIRGQAFHDQDRNGSRNGSEPVMAGVHLFIDSNGNGFPDPNELQTTTDASGNYQFNGLLPGEYPVRVSPVAGFMMPQIANASVIANTASQVDLAIEQLALSQIRGQLRTEQSDPIAYWKVFADLDRNGDFDDNEPMAISDRNSNFALAGLNAGDYTLRTLLPAGWSVAGGTNSQNVTLAANAISEGNHFTLKPTNTSVTGGLHFVTMPTATVEARQTFRYASVAMGIFTESISYDLSLAPEGMTVDPATGLMAWRPTIDQIGEHLVIVRATSQSGSISLHDFTLTVTAPNTPPALSQPQGSSPSFPPAYVGLVYAVNLSAQDAESQSITYNLLSGPSSTSLDPTTGTLRWTPTLADVGDATFSIELRDSLGATSIVNATVVVTNSQRTATPFVVTLLRTGVGLGQNYLGRLQGTDALHRPLSWSLVTGPTGLQVSSDGTVRWTPGNSDLGTHSIVVNASDVDGTIESKSYTLSVVGRTVNTVPNVMSQPITATTLGKQYQYDVVVVDSDSDPLSFALLNAPEGMSIHPSLGTIRWMPAADQLGEHSVSIQVTDPDGTFATQEFKIKVSRSGGPPSIRSVPPTEAAIGIGYLYNIAARDAEGDPLAYRLLTAPTGMTIAETTGVISWTPTAEQLGQQDVVIEVSDGVGGAVTQAFAIRVSAGVPNRPPVISSTAPRFGAVGIAYSYTLQATDPEGTAITYSLGQSPTGMTINASTGAVAWTPVAGQVGKFVVTLIATDAGGAGAVESFELDVLAANSPPTIASTAPLDSPAGAVFNYQVLGRDADLDQLSYSLTTAPTGATIDTFGMISWPTEVANIGSHDFAVRVADPRGGVATQSFTLSVIADTISPKVSIIENLGDANRNVLPWQGPFVVYVRAIDNVAVASLTLAANGRDIPLSAAGTATFTFDDWGFQRINATATAIDTAGNVATKTITFDYDFPEGWSGAGTEDIPTVAITSPTDTASVFGMVTITGTASHADFAGYKLSYRRVDETTFTEFHESTTAVTNGTLGVWDTTLLINDEYVIRLEAASNAGVVNVVEYNVGLSGELKLGNFRLSFTDMVIPVAGIPIEITRIYDTLQADREGDFGYGWRLEYRNTDLRVGLPKSGLEDIGIYPALRPGVKVFLNIPGEGRVGFTFNSDIRVLPGFGGNNLVLARPRFTPDPGVTATLSAGTSSYLQVNEYGELYAPGNIPYNPASPDFGGAYVLTTREGITYRIDGASGKMISAADRNQNTLLFLESGIEYQNGSLSIRFQRDVIGRIRSITDPNGNRIKYTYSLEGNLLSVVDRENHETSFTYHRERQHYLDTIVDPLGRVGTRVEYDESGRLQSLGDTSGSLLQYEFDTNSLIVESSDNQGRKTTLELDQQGNIVTLIDARGFVTQNTFNANGNPILTRGPEGEITRRSFDRLGNETSMTNASGHATFTTYSSTNKIKSFIDPRGSIIQYTEDAKGNITEVIDVNGSVSKFDYSPTGNVIAHEDSLGRRHEFAYSEQGWLTMTIMPDGSRIGSTYDRNGYQIETSRVVTADGQVQTAVESVGRNANGWVISQTNATQNTTHFQHDALGRQTRITDPLGRARAFSYENGRSKHPAQIQFANGAEQKFTFDSYGQATRFIGASGLQTDVEYDETGNPVQVRRSVTQDQVTSSTAWFDGLGRPTRISDGNGGTVEYFYSDFSRDWIRRVDAQGNVTLRSYDAMGNLAQETDSNGGRISIDNNAFGNVTSITYPDGGVHRKTYDSERQLILDTRPDGTSYRFGYDSLGRLEHVMDGLGNRTSYEYDSFGNIVFARDPMGARTQYVYDLAGRLIRRELPSGRAEQYQYDQAGNRISKVDAAGSAITYVYDAHNQLIAERLSGVSTSVATYTPAGSIQTQQSDLGSWAYEYNTNQQLTRKVDAFGNEISYEYDVLGRKVRVATGEGSYRYAYDNLGRLVTVEDQEGRTTSYSYDSNSNLVEIRLPNGLLELRSYDSRNRVVSIRVLDSTTTIASFDYEYDTSGRITRVIEMDRSIEYRYDTASRLAQEIHTSAGPTRSISYRYDGAGNRTFKGDTLEGDVHFEYGEDNRLLRSISTVGTTEYGYDQNGNIMSIIGPEGSKLLSWNERRRLISVTETSSTEPTKTVLYNYDPNGLMIERVVDGQSTQYVWDTTWQHPQIIAEVHSDGTRTNYAIGHERIFGQTGGKLQVYLSDQHSGVRATSDSDGSIRQRAAYTAFGESLGEFGVFDSLWQYRGEFRDPFTGLDYLRARHLDSTTGRFVSQDDVTLPASEVPQHNRYAYAANDPVNHADPSGNALPVFIVAAVEVALSIVAVVKAASAFIAGVEFAAAAVSLGASGFNAARVLHRSLGFNENIVHWQGKVKTFTLDLVLLGGTTFDAELNGSTFSIWDFGVGFGVSEGSGSADMDIWVPEKLPIPGTNPESLTGLFAHSGVSLGVHNPFAFHFGKSATGNIARMGDGVGFIRSAGNAKKDDPSWVGAAIDAGAFGYSKLTKRGTRPPSGR